MLTSGFRSPFENVACISSLIPGATITSKSKMQKAKWNNRMIMVVTNNDCDNNDDDDLQLNKMYKEFENKIVLLISPANFSTKKTTRSRTSYEIVNPAVGDRQM